MDGAQRIAQERQRQIEKEGWTPDHDAQHDDESLTEAAVCYAVNKAPSGQDTVTILVRGSKEVTTGRPLWPQNWNLEYDKREKHGRIRSLEIAGALIAAEIDRLLAEKGLDK